MCHTNLIYRPALAQQRHHYAVWNAVHIGVTELLTDAHVCFVCVRSEARSCV